MYSPLLWQVRAFALFFCLQTSSKQPREQKHEVHETRHGLMSYVHDAACLPGDYASLRLSPSGIVLAACTHEGEVQVLHQAQTGWERVEGTTIRAASPDAFAWLSCKTTSGHVKGSCASWLVIADSSRCCFYSVVGPCASGGRASQLYVVSLVSCMSLAAACKGPLDSARGGGVGAADRTPGQHAAVELRCRPHSLVADARNQALTLLQYVQGMGAPGCGGAPVHLVASMLQANGSSVARTAAFPLCCPSACACAALSWQAAAVSGALPTGNPLWVEWAFIPGHACPGAGLLCLILAQKCPRKLCKSCS